MSATTDDISSPPIGNCLGCGYSLRGLLEPRCPECGRRFDPADPKTMNFGRHYGGFLAWLLKPTRWLAPATPYLVALVLLLDAILLLPMRTGIFYMTILWLIVGWPYLFWGLCRWIVVENWRQPSALLATDRRARRKIHISLIVGLAMVYLQIPERPPFWFSRIWLDPWAHHLYTEVPLLSPAPPDHNCGIYRCRDISITPNGVLMTIGDRQVGYAPNEDSTPNESGRWRHLSGPWYSYDDFP